MSKWERIAMGMLSPMNPNGTLILGVFTMLWGIWIVSPFWTVFGSARTFDKVSEFAPEWAWGSWSISCGLLLIYALKNQRKRLVSFALGFHVWHWFVISGLLWWGDWRNTAGLTYSFIGLYALWSYLNFRLNFLKEHDHWWQRFVHHV